MQVILDQEQWEVGGQATMGQVLADVSERAHARARIVTSLTVDQRAISDRDLDQSFLNEAAGRYARLVAKSESQDDIVRNAQASIGKFSAEVKREGAALAGQFRHGRQQWGQLDIWMGKLADYLEFAESRPNRAGGESWTPFVQDLLKARTAGDMVLVADLLEYEVLPRIVA